MNNEIEKNVKENLIYEVRGKKVMLDSDLARLYECNNGTKELNQLVSRHIEKFSSDMYFQLTKKENDDLRSQLVTANTKSRSLPYAFTLEGIEVLNSLIRNTNKQKIYEKILSNFKDEEEKLDLVEMRANPYKIEDLIYEIRGRPVMLDSDLAKLYQCKNGTKDINKAVKRNIERFPENFVFKLTNDENLRFQIGTSNENNVGGRRYCPYAFTEQGVAMLSGVLKTEVAVKVSIAIMNAFVLMRKYISNNLFEMSYMQKQIITNSNNISKNTEDIKRLQESFNKFEEKKENVNEIYFNGQIYDAYSKIIDILREGKEEVIIIDRYADKSILDMIRDVDAKVTLIVKRNGLLKEIDIEKYNKQYHNLKIKYDDTYHDRYIIIDKKKVYHLGASLNQAGNRTFSINILEDELIKQSLFNNIFNLKINHQKN